MRTAHRVALAATILIPIVALSDNWNDRQRDRYSHNPKGLAQLVRNVTSQYWDIDEAMDMGYAPGPCVSGRNGGAMGVHLANFAYVTDGLPPDINAPEILIYEPLPNGRYRLAGVEFITLVTGEPQGAPAVEGHLLNYSGAPNRYGLPPHYELHVWAWKHNPDGTFADWNPDMTCDHYVAPTS